MAHASKHVQEKESAKSRTGPSEKPQSQLDLNKFEPQNPAAQQEKGSYLSKAATLNKKGRRAPRCPSEK